MKIVRYLTLGVAGLATAFTLSSCSSGGKVELVDLDVVLDQFVAQMEGLDSEANKDADEAAQKAMADTFVTNYADALNAAKMVSYPLGVEMRADGAFLGFKDKDQDRKKSDLEQEIFTVEVDQERDRLIATDLGQGYHRDHSGLRMAGSLVAGYMIGRMLMGQRNSGVNTSKFSNMKMKPKGFHKTAVSNAKAKSKASSARSSGGSKSFKSGK